MRFSLETLPSRWHVQVAHNARCRAGKRRVRGAFQPYRHFPPGEGAALNIIKHETCSQI
jgi:hypothetical protein